MRRIITAAVVVGIIIVDIARTYRQVNPWAAATTFDLNKIIPGAFAVFQKGRHCRCGIGHWRNAEEADRQQASQNRCEQIPTTHEIISHGQNFLRISARMPKLSSSAPSMI